MAGPNVGQQQGGRGSEGTHCIAQAIDWRRGSRTESLKWPRDHKETHSSRCLKESVSVSRALEIV